MESASNTKENMELVCIQELEVEKKKSLNLKNFKVELECIATVSGAMTLVMGSYASVILIGASLF